MPGKRSRRFGSAGPAIPLTVRHPVGAAGPARGRERSGSAASRSAKRSKSRVRAFLSRSAEWSARHVPGTSIACVRSIVFEKGAGNFPHLHRQAETATPGTGSKPARRRGRSVHGVVRAHRMARGPRILGHPVSERAVSKPISITLATSGRSGVVGRRFCRPMASVRWRSCGLTDFVCSDTWPEPAARLAIRLPPGRERRWAVSRFVPYFRRNSGARSGRDLPEKRRIGFGRTGRRQFSLQFPRRVSAAGGPGRTRTGVNGFAVRWIASLPPGRSTAGREYSPAPANGQHDRLAESFALRHILSIARLAAPYGSLRPPAGGSARILRTISLENKAE